MTWYHSQCSEGCSEGMGQDVLSVGRLAAVTGAAATSFMLTNCKPHTLEEEVLFPNNARVGSVLKHAQNIATRWGWGPRLGLLDLRVWLQSTLTTWNNNSNGNSWEDHATSSAMYEIVCNVHTICSMLLVLEVTFSSPPLDSWGSNGNLQKKSNLMRPRSNPR